MSMNKIRVILADDHLVVRMGLAAILRFEEDVEIVGEAEDGEEAVARCRELKPDVVIMDLRMPKLGGAEAIEAIRKENPSVRALVLTTFEASDDISRALAAGATGALLKNSSPGELAAAIRVVAAGGRVIAPDIERDLREDPPAPDLTERQRDILQSVTRGLTNRDIAKQFDISPSGVKAHLNAIFAKLGASGRSEAVAIALRKHLLKH